MKDKTEKGTAVCNWIPDSGYWCNGIVGPPQPLPMKRWFYDKNFNKCVCMVYNGCDGNGNNFAHSNECANFCGSSGSVNPEDNPDGTCFYFP